MKTENKTFKVLLIDDDADLVAVNEAVFVASGFKVEKAYNGDEGFELALTSKPDVIVLDVMMTTKSEGFDLARQLRGAEGTKEIPLIMLTSVHTTVPFRYEPDGEYLPVDLFLDKPVAPEALVKEVKKVLA